MINRIQIEFQSEGGLRLPLPYSYGLMSFVYRLLSSDADLSGELHASRGPRLYCYSGLSGETKLVDKTIMFRDGKASLEVRSQRPEVIAAILNSLTRQSVFMILGRKLNVARVIADGTVVTAKSLRIITMSPICVYETIPGGKTVYYSPSDDKFATLITRNFLRKYQALYNKAYDGDFSIELVSKNSIRKVVTKLKDTWVTAYHAELIIEARPEALQLLFTTGLGTKNSSGFGLFDIV